MLLRHMPGKPYELIWAHISCYSCRFMYYIPMLHIYPVSCLVEIKLFQIVSKSFHCFKNCLKKFQLFQLFQKLFHIVGENSNNKEKILPNALARQYRGSEMPLWTSWQPRAMTVTQIIIKKIIQKFACLRFVNNILRVNNNLDLKLSSKSS